MSDPHPMTPEGLALRLRSVARMMADLGSDMDYIGGFGEIGDHGREMVGAAAVAVGWADGIDADLASRHG